MFDDPCRMCRDGPDDIRASSLRGRGHSRHIPCRGESESLLHSRHSGLICDLHSRQSSRERDASFHLGRRSSLGSSLDGSLRLSGFSRLGRLIRFCQRSVLLAVPLRLNDFFVMAVVAFVASATLASDSHKAREHFSLLTGALLMRSCKCLLESC